MTSPITHIIFDFDGVMVDSNLIRHEGYRDLFADEQPAVISKLFEYTSNNGGLSRYEIIRYAYHELLNRSADDALVQQAAARYSKIVSKKVEQAPDIPGAIDFLSVYSQDFELSLISSSDQAELRVICKRRCIDQYFGEILGSPTVKSDNLIDYHYRNGIGRDQSIYVGDTLNDWQACQKAEVLFVGFGYHLKGYGFPVVGSFEELRSKIPAH